MPDDFDRDCLEHFENTIRPYDNIEIVISSTWRLVYTFKTIRELFSDDIQQRVVGMTPETYSPVLPYERHNEVLMYLKQNGGEKVKWVAIDDNPEHFPAKCPVILTESNKGFNHASAAELQEILEHQ